MLLPSAGPWRGELCVLSDGDIDARAVSPVRSEVRAEGTLVVTLPGPSVMTATITALR